jgi:hypothetical protein
MDNSVLWYSDGIRTLSDSLSYSHSTQRENDFRDAVVKTGITGYLEATFTWNWAWSPAYSSTSQSFYFQTSGGSTIYSTSGGGGSGSKTFTIPNLDFNQTYRIYMTASSFLGGNFALLTASGSLNWTYETYG